MRRLRRSLAPLAVLAAALAAAGCGTSKELLLAGPLEELPDRQPVPEPKAVAPNQYYDFADNTVFRQIHSWFDLPRWARGIAGTPKQAVNVDAFDEVPNSTWFTNRGERLSLEEALRGPNQGDGPDRSAPWRVRGVKTQGVTPGFRIKDARGDTYLLKFDPLTNPEMASGAEIVCTKLAWAAGYNTAENYLVFFGADQLSIEGDVTLVDEFGEERTLTRDDVDRILQRVPRAPDGTIRAVASKFLPGKPMGPYSYLGTRGDDPNDRFRHEHRRELRGLYVFAAWINHNDVRRINSLDMYVPEGHLMHYLIDFGATLGSASIGPNLPSEGFEYQADFAEAGKSLFTLGLHRRPWQGHVMRADPAIGWFGAEGFDPATWKPNYPNLAFQRCTDRDGFWGAKQVMALDDERIRGIVAQARYSDPDVERFIADTLIRRRDRIGRYWCARVNPLDGFRVEGEADGAQRLAWIDRAIDAGYEPAEGTTYRAELFHNDFGGRDESVLGARTANGPALALSREDLAKVAAFCDERELGAGEARLFYVKIRTARPAGDAGGWVKAHLLWTGSGFEAAGIERQD
jgi:hypothetical protein